jgi:RHS repeat-associated protein
MTVATTCAIHEVPRLRSICSGEQYDSDLGLYYLRARYYNPQTGRFLSRDPEDGKIKIPATLHKYLYANGDPVNRIDPRGREADEEAVLTYTEIGVRTVPEIKELAGAIACVFAVELYVLDLAREQVDSIDKWGGGAGVIGGCALYLWTY